MNQVTQEEVLAVGPVENAVIGTLMAEPETTISDPPVQVPSCAGGGIGLLGLLLSPKLPKDPKPGRAG